MKTILHISKYYYPDLGGIENTAQQLAEGMQSRGYRNVVVCYSHDSMSRHDVISGIEVYRVGVQFSLLSQDFAFSYYNVLKKLIKQYTPDYIHVHCPNPFVYPIVTSLSPKGTKVILHWHSDILAKGLAYNIVKPLEKKILKRADAIVITSPNYLKGSKPILPYKDKVSVLQSAIVPSILDLRECDNAKISEIKNKYQGKTLVFIVGRHVPYKGMDLLIQSEHYIKGNVQILIGGKGPETEHLKALANDRQRIEFLGRLSDDDLRCYLWASDILGFASNTKAEAFGLALAEGMYCKCIPVTFTINGSGVNWVSQNGKTGIEVPLGDIKAYANAIDTLVNDDDLRNKYATAAHQRIIDNFTTEKAVDRMVEVYSKLK